MLKNITIKKTTPEDLEKILTVEMDAFNNDKSIKTLITDLLNDKTAQPLISLLAFDENKPVGHIIFSKAPIEGNDKIKSSLLVPLAVIPEYQKQGIGGQLIEEGFKILSQSETDIVFVLGHPEYYPRHGFTPAGCQGFEAPYPIPEEHAGAWMLKALKGNIVENNSGKVKCSEALDKPEYWRE